MILAKTLSEVFIPPTIRKGKYLKGYIMTTLLKKIFSRSEKIVSLEWDTNKRELVALYDNGFKKALSYKTDFDINLVDGISVKGKLFSGVINVKNNILSWEQENGLYIVRKGKVISEQKLRLHFIPWSERSGSEDYFVITN